MIKDTKSGGLQVFRDGFSNLTGGMDTSRYPNLIGATYAALGVNVSFRGGRPKTRPQFVQQGFTGTGLSALTYGLFQGGCCYYSTAAGRSILLGMYSGWLVATDIVAGTSTILNTNHRMDLMLKTYIFQAEKFAIVQNGKDSPLIWDGSAPQARESNASGGPVTVGTNNTYITAPDVNGNSLVTTLTPHGLADGDYIQLDGVDSVTYDTQFYITTPLTATTFTIYVGVGVTPATVFGTTQIPPSVPIGLIGSYGQGRIFMSSPDRRSFTAGDIIYGDTNGTVENILRWTENQYLAEGLNFALPANQGRIKAMTFPAFQDTTTGQGQLFVFGEYGTSSFAVDQPRADILDPVTNAIVTPGWRDIQIQKIVLAESGCTSQWSTLNFTNGDLMYRDQVGIRTYRNARGDMQSYGQTPISAEVNRILNNDGLSKLDYISSTHFDNRALTTCTPEYLARQILIKSISQGLFSNTATFQCYSETNLTVGDSITVVGTHYDGTYSVDTVIDAFTFTITTPPGKDVTVTSASYITGPTTGTEIYHRGLISLDFNSTSTVGGKSSPAWDGVWCGINFQQVVSGFFDGRSRCFAFVYGGPGNNQIWELASTFGDDIPLGVAPIQLPTTPIQCQLETRAFDFQAPFNKKKLRRLDLWLSNIIGTVTMDASYHMDGKQCWTEWPPTWQRCATVQDPVLTEENPYAQGYAQNLPQIRNQITQPMPPNVCDPVVGGFTSLGFDAQVRLVWTGNLTIDKLVVTADDIVENQKAVCPAGPTVTPVTPS